MKADHVRSAGDLAVQYGRLSMCLEPEFNMGPHGISELWVSIGLRYELMQRRPNNFWTHVQCTAIDPTRLSATFEPLPMNDVHQRLRGSITITAEQVLRLFPMRGQDVAPATAEEELDQRINLWKMGGGLRIRSRDQFVLNTWKAFLGDRAFNRLDGLLNSVEMASASIVRMRDAETRLPTAELARHITNIASLLGEGPQRMEIAEDLSDSAQAAYGAVCGALIGDAVGGVLEFLGHVPTKKECLAALTLPGGGIFDLAPGQFTDDGEITVSLLRALAEQAGTYNVDGVAREYVNWANSSPFDIGNATSNALRLSGDAGNTAARGLSERVVAQAAAFNRASMANGSLMRATPLGILAATMSDEEAITMAHIDASLTHPNERCKNATAAYVLAIRHLILNPGDSEGAFLQAQQYAEAIDSDVAFWLTEAMEGALPDTTKTIGFVRYGFTLAFFHLYNATTFRQALLQTLECGGDTDTNACIVGGLVGALHGVHKIPSKLIDGLLACEAENGQARPDRYTIKPVLRDLNALWEVVEKKLQ